MSGVSNIAMDPFLLKELSSTKVIFSGEEPSPLSRATVVLRSSLLLTERPPSSTNLLTEEPINEDDDGGSNVNSTGAEFNPTEAEFKVVDLDASSDCRLCLIYSRITLFSYVI